MQLLLKWSRHKTFGMHYKCCLCCASLLWPYFTREIRKRHQIRTSAKRTYSTGNRDVQNILLEDQIGSSWREFTVFLKDISFGLHDCQKQCLNVVFQLQSLKCQKAKPNRQKKTSTARAWLLWLFHTFSFAYRTSCNCSKQIFKQEGSQFLKKM